MLENNDFSLVEKEMHIYNKMMCDAIDTLLLEDVSRYPMFVVSKSEMEIGLELAHLSRNAGGWNINLSTLEEFVTKNIIADDKIEDFKKIYKSTASHICIFLNWKNSFTFIFLPRHFTNS